MKRLEDFTEEDKKLYQQKVERYFKKLYKKAAKQMGITDSNIVKFVRLSDKGIEIQINNKWIELDLQIKNWDKIRQTNKIKLFFEEDSMSINIFTRYDGIITNIDLKEIVFEELL